MSMSTTPMQTVATTLLDLDDYRHSISALDAVSFAEPSHTGKETCLCPLDTAHGAAMHVKLPYVRVVKIAVQKGTATLLLQTSNSIVRFLTALDARCLRCALDNSNSWFMHRIKSDLIEDFFRPSTELLATDAPASTDGACGSTIAARLKVQLPDGELGVMNIKEGQAYEMNLKLLGLQFRKQHFCVVWKLLAAKKVAAKKAAPPVAFLEDEEGAGSAATTTDDDILLAGFSSKDDFAAILDGIGMTLSAREAEHLQHVKDHKAALAHIKGLRQRLSGIQAVLAGQARGSGSGSRSIKSSSCITDALRALNALSEELDMDSSTSL